MTTAQAVDRLRETQRFRGEGVLVGGLFLALALVAFLFPRSGDDWAWGSSLGVERLQGLFADYNGRYAGNLLILLLVRTPWLAPFVVSATLVGLVVLIVVFTRMRSLAGYGVTTALVLLMPLGEWRESVAWLSGFTNYTTAGLVLLAVLCVLQRSWTHPEAGSRRVLATLFAGVVVGQLFVEHVTLAVLAAALVNLAAQWRLRPRVSPVAAVVALGSVVGAVVMFSNSRYRSAASGASTYQGIGPSSADGSGLSGLLHQGTGPISQLAVADESAVTLVILVLVVVLAARSGRAEGRLRAPATAAVVLAGLAVVLGAVIRLVAPAGEEVGPLTGWSWLCAGALLLALLLTAGSLVESRTGTVQVVAAAAVMLVLVGPMAIVRPYGPRNFLPSHLLLVLIALVLLGEVLRHRPQPAVARRVGQVGVVLTVLALVYYGAVYAVIHHAYDQRLDRVRAAVSRGAGAVQVDPLPLPDYVHGGDPIPGPWTGRFKRYYHVPDSVRVSLRAP